MPFLCGSLAGIGNNDIFHEQNVCLFVQGTKNILKTFLKKHVTSENTFAHKGSCGFSGLKIWKIYHPYNIPRTTVLQSKTMLDVVLQSTALQSHSTVQQEQPDLKNTLKSVYLHRCVDCTYGTKFVSCNVHHGSQIFDLGIIGNNGINRSSPNDNCTTAS